MTTQPQTPQTILPTSIPEKKPVVDYTAALRQYRQYGRGRSMRRFCSDEGYDYRKFRYCTQRGIKETSIQSTALTQTSDKITGFIALIPEKEPDIKPAITKTGISEIIIRFSSGMELNLHGGKEDEMLSVITKMGGKEDGIDNE